METVKSSAKFKEEGLDKGVPGPTKSSYCGTLWKMCSATERDPVHPEPGALCPLCPSPSSLEFVGAFVEPSEYATALTKPFFKCQLPNENLVSELPF